MGIVKELIATTKTQERYELGILYFRKITFMKDLLEYEKFMNVLNDYINICETTKGYKEYVCIYEYKFIKCTFAFLYELLEHKGKKISRTKFDKFLSKVPYKDVFNLVDWCVKIDTPKELKN